MAVPRALSFNVRHAPSFGFQPRPSCFRESWLIKRMQNYKFLLAIKKGEAFKLVLTQLADLVEHGNASDTGNEVVAPDPLVLNVVLKRELGELGGESVWISHGTSNGLFCFVGHCSDWITII